MKYIRKYNEAIERSIEDWCVEFNIKSFKINKDNIVSSKKDVELFKNQLEKIPIQFGIVGGNFNLSYNNLTSLKGSPRKVGVNFYCNNNHLKSLEYGPVKVGNNYDCSDNDLLTLKGSPKKVVNWFSCQYKS
jgi:hypothetical protein